MVKIFQQTYRFTRNGLLSCAALITCSLVLAQSPQTPQSSVNKALPDFRQPAPYAPSSLAQSVKQQQLAEYARQLLEFCANPDISDTFVEQNLRWFSTMSGQDETCRTLAHY